MTKNNEHRFSIYAGEPMRRVLAQSPRDNRSGRLNDVCARYDAIIQHELSRLSFTEGEWCAIVDANNGTIMNDEGMGWRVTFYNVMDDEALDAKWGIDRLALARRMKALRIPAQAAIGEVVERFWASVSSDADRTMPYADRLRACGAVLAEPVVEPATE